MLRYLTNRKMLLLYSYKTTVSNPNYLSARYQSETKLCQINWISYEKRQIEFLTYRFVGSAITLFGNEYSFV